MCTVVSRAKGAAWCSVYGTGEEAELRKLQVLRQEGIMNVPELSNQVGRMEALHPWWTAWRCYWWGPRSHLCFGDEDCVGPASCPLLCTWADLAPWAPNLLIYPQKLKFAWENKEEIRYLLNVTKAKLWKINNAFKRHLIESPPRGGKLNEWWETFSRATECNVRATGSRELWEFH